MEDKKWYEPELIKKQYEDGVNYKNGLGTRGLYAQNKVNERFMVGDQWHGAKCGNDRPLVRHNVIKRIADYKMAVVGSNPITVNFSAEGVPNTQELQKRIEQLRDGAAKSGMGELTGFNTEIPTDEEINLVMSALSTYFDVTAERVKFEDLKEQVLRDAYVGGTGILYTYWDDSIRTGLYANESRTAAIKGDIACEVLDVENVYFGDPSTRDLQKQPYVVIAQRKGVDEIKRIMKANKRPHEDIEKIKPDSDYSNQAGHYGDVEQQGTRRTLLLTKLYKEYDDNGEYRIMATMVSNGVTVRKPWDIGVRVYPLAVFPWERRKNSIYGESEVTHLIPNQIAINRMMTAAVWAVMIVGMPTTLVNRDMIQQPVTNEPAQIIYVSTPTGSLENAMKTVQPPTFSPNYDNMIMSMISQTLIQSGANESALGDVNPENTSAIIAVREAATMPMQTVQNRFFSFVEDVARIWAEFFVSVYGKRQIKNTDADGSVWYMPFDGARYKDLVINAKIDVGASTLWSKAQSIRTLDNLFDRGVLNVFQYLSRLPKGTVPNVNGLLREMSQANQAVAESTGAVGGEVNTPAPLTEEDVINGLSEDMRAVYDQIPEQSRTALVKNAIAEGSVL